MRPFEARRMKALNYAGTILNENYADFLTVNKPIIDSLAFLPKQYDGIKLENFIGGMSGKLLIDVPSHSTLAISDITGITGFSGLSSIGSVAPNALSVSSTLNLSTIPSIPSFPCPAIFSDITTLTGSSISGLNTLNQITPISNLLSIQSKTDQLPAPIKIQKNVNVQAKITKKRVRQRCKKLENFVQSWIRNGYSFGDFSKEMKELYLHRSKPEDDDTYNAHHAIKRVYLTHKDGDNYTVHYSLISPNGQLRPKQKPPALSSFKRIFAQVEKKMAGANQG